MLLVLEQLFLYVLVLQETSDPEHVEPDSESEPFRYAVCYTPRQCGL